MTYLRCHGICLDELRKNPWEPVSGQMKTGYLPDSVLQYYHYSNLFSYIQCLLEKAWDKCRVLNTTNYDKFFHIIIYFVHRHQIQLLTLPVTKTFLTFASQAVFHSLSFSGGCNFLTPILIKHQCWLRGNYMSRVLYDQHNQSTHVTVTTSC